jgi:hypothetical protein
MIPPPNAFQSGLPLAAEVPPGTYFQYMGFGQEGSLREYRFRRISRGVETIEFVMNADLTLFAKHHVGIQEGPGLCLHILLGQGAASGAPAAAAPRSLTESDMLAHLASRPSPQAKGTRRSPSVPRAD